MRNFLFLLLSFFCGVSHAQVFFDESRLNNIYITMNPNDLNTLYQDVQSDVYYKATFVYVMPNRRDTITNVGFRLRGNTSRVSAKKSFKVSFNEFEAAQKYQGLKKLNLNGAHNDPAVIREKLFYHVWRKAGLPERRASFVRVFINNNYYGAYTMMEEISKEWLEDAYGNNGGNLYKCLYPGDLAYLGTDQNKYKAVKHSNTERAYNLKTNEILDDYSDLVKLCAQLDQAPNATFEQKIHEVLNVNATLKAMAVEVMTGHWDDYIYNKNNYYLYKNNKTGKFEFISYDADNTLGVDWVQRDWATRNVNSWLPSSSNEKRPLVSKLLAIPNFRQQYNLYIDSIAKYIMHPDSIFPYINKIHTMVRPAIVSDPFYSKDYGYTLQNYNDALTKTIDGHTPYGIKPFISRRLEYASIQLILAPREVSISSLSLKMYPNPTNETLNLEAPYEGFVRLRIYNMLGQQQTQQHIFFMRQHQLQIGILPQGYYIVQLENEGGQILAQGNFSRL